jgi:hypothetical protein
MSPYEISVLVCLWLIQVFQPPLLFNGIFDSLRGEELGVRGEGRKRVISKQ